MLASRAMDAAPRSALPDWRSAEAALLVVVGVLLVAAVFHGAGSRTDSLASVGIGALVAASIALCAALRGALVLPRLERAAAAAVFGATALTVWAGTSMAWSIAGDRSWDWLGRGLVYLAFLVLGLLLGALAAGERPRYQIEMEVDRPNGVVVARQLVTYVNNTGAPLESVVFKAMPAYYGGFAMESTLVDGQAATPRRDGWIVEVPLAPALAPDGRVAIELRFRLDVPSPGNMRYRNAAGVLALGNW